MGKQKLKYTTEEFKEKIKKVWGDRYILDKVEYTGINNKIIVTCPIHGDFQTKANDFINHHGCQKCGGTKKMTTDEFITKAKLKHGNKYDYSKTNLEHKDEQGKIIITCPIHGDFKQKPTRHLYGDKCPLCYKNFKKTTEQFIEEAREVHGDKYDYSKVDYQGNKIPIIIICNKHGEFKQTPLYHLQNHGCQQCYYERSGETRKKTTEQFIKEAKEIHGNKYDYSLVDYQGNKEKVVLTCPKHGKFMITPNKHLGGQGCDACADEQNGFNKRLTKEQFIRKAREIHGWKYDYSLVNYQGYDVEVEIICPVHGVFKQKPSIHLAKGGCQKCRESHLEKELSKKLDEVKIKYEYQKRFDWLGRQSLDFYLPDYNIAIECQGSQHYSETLYNGWNVLNNSDVVNRDITKKELCENNNVKLLYYSNDKKIFDIDIIYNNSNTYTSLNELINSFLNG